LVVVVPRRWTQRVLISITNSDIDPLKRRGAVDAEEVTGQYPTAWVRRNSLQLVSYALIGAGRM
jgi:hypothetical protein